MIVLDGLVRIAADRVRCRITREGVRSEFTVRVTQYEEYVRGFSFENMSPQETWELSNRDEFRALMKVFWAFWDGAFVELPKRIVSDLPGAPDEFAIEGDLEPLDA